MNPNFPPNHFINRMLAGGEILIPEEPLTHRIHCDHCGRWIK